jgi:hypothetical protein
MITEKSWSEFRKTGLLLFVNSFLHIFGWVLVYETENDRMYPARTKFRGFDNKDVEEAHIKLADYMKETVDELHKEVNE